MKSKTSKTKKHSKKISIEAVWEPINVHAAGVDIGSREHWACVPREASDRPVRKFGTFTADLEAMTEWFKACGVTSIAMEATGIYWIPLFQILERSGLQVILVNARQTKNVAGRKSDVQDCQWIQRLHTYGLLQGSFRPEDPYCVSRFRSEKHFCSWLGLCPDNRISGGKLLSSRTRRVINRASDALRLAARSLERSQSALGGFARRMKARLGAAEGITATAHKLARIVYRLIKHGEAYVRQGLEDYERKFVERKLNSLQKTAKAMGFELIQKQPLPQSVS